MIEPSNAEQATWSDVTRNYVRGLEAAVSDRLREAEQVDTGMRRGKGYRPVTEETRLLGHVSVLKDEVKRLRAQINPTLTAEIERLREAFKEGLEALKICDLIIVANSGVVNADRDRVMDSLYAALQPKGGVGNDHGRKWRGR